MNSTDIKANTTVGVEKYSAYRWVVLLLAWAAFLVSFIDRLAWSNVDVQVSKSLGLSLVALGSFVTAFYIGYIVMNALGGVATDLLGGRLMLSASIFFLGIFTALFSLATSLTFGLILQVLMGLAAGADYAACIKLIMSWFKQHDRGMAMGLFMTASSLGVIVTNAIIPSYTRSHGWSGAYQFLGIITIVIAVLCIALLRNGPVTRQPVKRERPDVAILIRNRDFLLLSLAGFGALWGTWGFAFWASALMIKGYHITPIKAGAVVALFGIGAIITKPLVGLLSDWLGGIRKLPIIIILLAFVVMLLIFGSQHSLTAFYWLAPVLGVTAFVYSPLMNAMVPEVTARSVIGSSAGISNAFWQLGSVIVPLVVGIVFQSTHSFYAAFIALAVGPLLGALFMLPVRERKAF